MCHGRGGLCVSCCLQWLELVCLLYSTSFHWKSMGFGPNSSDDGKQTSQTQVKRLFRSLPSFTSWHLTVGLNDILFRQSFNKSAASFLYYCSSSSTLWSLPSYYQCTFFSWNIFFGWLVVTKKTITSTQPNVFTLTFWSLPETFIRRRLFSSSGSCHDRDVTWQEN